MLNRRMLLAAGSTAVFAGRAAAQTSTIKIGSIQDVSGIFADDNGAGTIACIRAAMDEVGDTLRVELLQADHQHKPDVGLGIARQWLDSGVDAIIGFDDSAVALAVNGLARDRDRVLLATNVGVATLSGVSCTPNETHWAADTAMLARVIGTALTKQGGETWYVIGADYVYGVELAKDIKTVVDAHGGRVVGSTLVPLGTTDFGSALLLAQASGAKVIALTLSGDDLNNCLKQAAEFGVARSGVVFAAMVIHEKVIHSLGLKATQGLTLTGVYYWNASDRTRDFAKRIMPHNKGVPPNANQASAYSAVRHYLRAVAAMGPEVAKRSGRATVQRMKQLPVDDDVLTNASIRPDGRVVSDVHLLRTKAPSESKSEWDLLKIQATLDPSEAWRPMSEGGCPLVRT